MLSQTSYPKTLLRRGIVRAAVLTLIWWGLTEGGAMAWIMGGPALVAATLASVALLPATTWRWRAGGAIRFLWYFVRYSIMGGLDVARRAFHPQLPLIPGFHEHTLRLLQEPARTFFVSVMNLLPGTLSATFHGERVTVHVLDTTQPVAEQLQALEGVIATLFGGHSPPRIAP
jgi:multicomponent Na+:H+ antiporter subunit E